MSQPLPALKCEAGNHEPSTMSWFGLLGVVAQTVTQAANKSEKALDFRAEPAEGSPATSAEVSAGAKPIRHDEPD